MDSIKAVVEKVLFPPVGSERDWYILSIRVGDKKECAKGNLSWRPEENERLLFEGEWTAYRGQKEFKFRSAMPDIPVDSRDQLAYVCSRTRGIGDAIELMIWETMGENWRKVTEKEVKSLGRAGILERFQETIDIVELEAEKSQIIAWLMGHNCTIKMASAAWDSWEKQSFGVVNSDPYRLCELPNYGFRNVENGIRQSFGITDNDPRRIRAGVLYSMQQCTDQGSTAIDWSVLKDKCLKNLGSLYLNQIVDEITRMFSEGALRGFEETQRISIGVDHQNELEIYEYVNTAR